MDTGQVQTDEPLVQPAANALNQDTSNLGPVTRTQAMGNQLDSWKQAGRDNAPQPTATPGTGTIAPQNAPAAPQAPPVVLTPVRRGIMGAVDKIADALAGTTKPEIAKDQDGNSYVKETTLSRGEQWSRVGAELVAGAAAGFGAGRGNNPGGAAAAGLKTGMDLRKGEQENRQQMTAQARQQTLDNANNQMLRMQMAEQSWRMTRMQTEASQKDIEFSQGQVDRFTKEGGQVLGTAAHPWDLDAILKVNPDTMKDMIQKHQIEIVSNYDTDGKPAGITAIKMPTGYRAMMLPSGSTFHTFDATTGQLTEHKASDPMTAGERDDYDFAAASAKMKFDSDKVEQALKQSEANEHNANAGEAPLKQGLIKSETVKNYADAHKAETEAKVLNTANDAGTISSNAQQLVEGSMDPSNLSKRAKTYDPTLAAANAYSMQKYGKPFDIAKAMGDYKFATNTQTYNTLNFLNSLVGRDNQGGNLAVAVQALSKVGNGQFPPLNAVEQWAKISAGDPNVAAARAALLEVDDQIAKILQGGGSGSSTTDAKLKQASEVLDKNFSPQQFKAVANDSLRPLLGNRKKEIIGDNRYLEQWHGASQPQQPQTQPGAGHSISLGNARNLPQFSGQSDAQITAAARQLGYTVTP